MMLLFSRPSLFLMCFTKVVQNFKKVFDLFYLHCDGEIISADKNKVKPY